MTSEFRMAGVRPGTFRTFLYQSRVKPQNFGVWRSPGMSLNPNRIITSTGLVR
jgi:hypothetical protein